PWPVGYRPDRMLACDGSVTTLCACAREKRTPRSARRSIHGVDTLALPYAPSASALSVSIVIRRTLRSASRLGRRLSQPRLAHAISTAASEQIHARVRILLTAPRRPASR